MVGVDLLVLVGSFFFAIFYLHEGDFVVDYVDPFLNIPHHLIQVCDKFSMPALHEVCGVDAGVDYFDFGVDVEVGGFDEGGDFVAEFLVLEGDEVLEFLFYFEHFGAEKLFLQFHEV